MLKASELERPKKHVWLISEDGLNMGTHNLKCAPISEKNSLEIVGGAI